MVVLSPIFVAETKIISRHDFVAPLMFIWKTFSTCRDRICLWKLILDGYLGKYRSNAPFCDDIRHSLYFLEYVLPTTQLRYYFLLFKYISIIHLWTILSNNFGTKIIRLTQHFSKFIYSDKHRSKILYHWGTM